MTHLLELKDIEKTYPDGRERRAILSGANLAVDAGEFVAIVGPSGSGKSTLLSIAGMLLGADAGEVWIAGENMSARRHKDWTAIRREHIGFIFQNHQLLPYLKVRDQLGVANPIGTASADAMLEDLGIAAVAEQYPAKLSGGERQRVAIARAFAGQPPLILADEPTASLDGERGRQIVSMIRHQVKRGRHAAVMVTHDTRVLDLVDRIYHLNGGRLVAE